MKREFEFIESIRKQTPTNSPNLELGIGDDAAIFKASSDQEFLITTDLLTEHIHFELDYTPANLLGYKALAVNLSDIAAMGGKPQYFLLSLARPRSLSDKYLEEMIVGMQALAQEYQVTLIGGDTCASHTDLTINITVIGQIATGQAVRRSRAQIGEAIYVSGRLGASALGLQYLQAGQRVITSSDLWAFTWPEERTIAQALRAHLQPQPRLALGQFLATHHLASAMLDISDGLAGDLAHICTESQVGAEIYAERLPIAAGASLKDALSGGEDYELLFTVPANQVARIAEVQAAFPELAITQIGQIVAQGYWLIVDGQRQVLEPQGYDHFSAK